MNIQEIKNETLHKLNREEIVILGLVNKGVGIYRGDLKTRYNGVKRQSNDGITFWYEGESFRMEFTEIESEEVDGFPVRHWAARIWNKKRNAYETYPMGIMGCDFFR